MAVDAPQEQGSAVAEGEDECESAKDFLREPLCDFLNDVLDGADGCHHCACGRLRAAMSSRRCGTGASFRDFSNERTLLLYSGTESTCRKSVRSRSEERRVGKE